MRIPVAFHVALAGVLLLPSTVATARSNEADKVEPQIVRLSLVEGDVRIARDQQQGQAKNADWEKALTGLPLQSGFSIATDTGRAVIELQDASTIYMAPNSVLVLNDLTALGNTPHTEVALLSGTVTLHVHPAFPGEKFILRAPTDTMSVNYPDHTDFRVTAYMDALALTPLEKAVLPGKAADQSDAVGHTLYYRAGKQVTVSDKGDEAAMASWDKWVAGKFAERVAAYNSVAKEAGIKSFVPGLDSLQGKGKFVDCGQYGKCWEPPQPPADQQQASAQAGVNAQANASGANTPAASALAANSVQSDAGSSETSSTQPVIIRKTSVAPRSGGGSGLAMVGGMGFDPFFPCGPGSFYYGDMMMYSYGGMMMSPYGGMMGMYPYGGMMAGYGGMYDPYLWNWAVCHTGSWIYQNNQYLWVPGGGSQIHYQPPVQWVKWGGKQGYVPIHPRDIAGQTPVNLQHGMIVSQGRNSFATGPVRMNSGGSVKVLNSPPRAFRQGYTISLARADSPRIEGRLLGTAAGPKGPQAGGARTVPITFDHGSRSFMVARQIGEGHSIRTVNEPVNSFLVRSGTGAFGGPMGGYRPVAEPGGRGGNMGAFEGGNRGAFNGGNNGDFRGGSVFNGGAQRGNGGFGGNNGGFNGGPAMGGGNNGNFGGPSGGSMGGGSMGGGAMGGGHMGGGSMGGGSMGGGSMGGGSMGGGHAGGSAPAGAPGR